MTEMRNRFSIAKVAMNSRREPLANLREGSAPMRRIVRAFSFCSLAIAAAFLVGCGDGSLAVKQFGATVENGSRGESLHVAWSTHPDSTVTGYRVLKGASADSATMVVATDLPLASIPSSQISQKVVSIDYRTWEDLGLRFGDQACFRIQAYNQDGMSQPTSGVCITI